MSSPSIIHLLCLCPVFSKPEIIAKSGKRAKVSVPYALALKPSGLRKRWG